MATMGTKHILLLGLVVAALVLPFAHAAVTIYNPAGLVMDIQIDDKNVHVTTPSMSMDLTQAEQELQVSVADRQAVDLTVRDGEELIVIPDPADSSKVKVLRVVTAGEEPQPVVKVEPVPPRRFAAAPIVRADIAVPPNPSVRPIGVPNPAVRP